MHLNNYTKGAYDQGTSWLRVALWWFIGQPILASRWLPFSRIKVIVLRIFGAKIGREVVVKPGVQIKFPWRLSVGDYSWIGEQTWFDNLAHISVGSHCCISQGAYLCAGSHRWDCDGFDLVTEPITIADHVWIAAKAVLAPGTTVGDGCVIALGAVVKGKLDPWKIYAGNPAKVSRSRSITDNTYGLAKTARKILFVNQTYAPDESATAQYLGDVTEELVSQGCKVTVLTSRRGYLDRDVTYPKHEVIAGVEVIRVGGARLCSHWRIARVIAAIWEHICIAATLVRMPQYDSVVAMTSPPMVAFTVRFFCRKPRREFICWVLDLNPDQAVAAGWIRSESFLNFILKRAVRWVFRSSDRVIVLDNHMRKRVVERGADIQKVQVSALWADTSNITYSSTTAADFRNANGLGSQFVVMYSGNMSLCHPLNTILSAAELLREDSSTMFVFIGGGPRTEEVREFANAKSLANLKCFPYQPRKTLSNSLSAADVHLVSFGEPFVGLLHPSKIYGIMAAGRPAILVGPEDCFINETIIEAEAGFRIDHDDPAALVARIKWLKQLSAAERAEFQGRALELAQKFEKSRQVQEITRTLI